jgi:hypothetical protein
VRELRQGDAFGPYVLDRPIDRGAFGRVWRAEDPHGHRIVAIKVLSSETADEERARARTDLERLAAAAARDSRHIVRVLASGHEPAPHIVMEFIDGTNLRDVLAEKGALPQEEAMRIALEVADALRALHRVRVVHRDVKPANILLDQQGEVRLTDFGIAKILGYDETVTLTQQNLLSAPYAAPEVWEGAPNPSSDLYALGAIVFEMLTGRPPFQGDLMDLFRQHRTEEPDMRLLPQHTAPSLRELVYLCLRKSPDERPQSAEACIRLLEKAQKELREEPQRFGPWVRLAPHPAQEWAWTCRHEKTGEEAVVEVHFAEDEAYGERLRAALNANPALTPLGAEKLLGTNRLLLGDDEGWPNAPDHNLAFWVARQEQDVQQDVEEFDRETLARAADAFLKLIDAAKAEGLRLAVDADRAIVLADGSVHLRRPGLPPDASVEPRLGAYILLRSLPMTDDAARSAAAARDLRDLRDRLARPAPSPEELAAARRTDRGVFVLAGGLAFLGVAVTAAALLLSSGGKGGAGSQPTPPPSAVNPCAPLALPAPIAAAFQACASGPAAAFAFDATCPRGQACRIEPGPSGPVISGNDQTIAYVDPNGDLYLAREDGFTPTRILQDGHVRDPAWSPDGRYLAFVVAMDTPDGYQTELWVIDTKEPASAARVLSSRDGPKDPEFRRRRIMQPKWGADGHSLYFLWQGVQDAAEVWRIDLTPAPAGLDIRDLRTWNGEPRNLNRAALTGAELPGDTRVTSLQVLADGSLLAEFCSQKQGGCGLLRWDGGGPRVLAPLAPGARFIAPQLAGEAYYALAVDGPDVVLVTIDAAGEVRGVARLSSGSLDPPDPASLSLSLSPDGTRALVGSPAGLQMVTIADGSVRPAADGRWAAWYAALTPAPGVSPPEVTPFQTPVLTPSPPARPTPPPGGDTDLAGELVTCALGQELTIRIRNLGPAVLDRDTFISVRTTPGNTSVLGSTNVGLTGMRPDESRVVPTGVVVKEPVQVVIDNVRDRRPENNVVTCNPQ